MATSMLNFPIGLVVDGMLSFIQNRFSKPEIVPPEYRWSPDDRQSRIRISGTFAIDNQKPGSIPSITVRRSGLQFAGRTFDNLDQADANVFTNAKHRDWLDGFIEIICESGAASEASSLANFLAIEIQANRHAIIYTLKFIRYLMSFDIGPEIPVEGTVEKRRWQVTLRFKASVYLGWIARSEDTIPFDKLNVTNISDQNMWKSATGVITSGQTYIEDDSADFGILTTNNPQLLQAELDHKWYYVLIGDSNRLYTIEEIVTNHKLRLSDKDINDAVVPFNPTASVTGAVYKIVWNTVHLKIDLPNNS